MAAPSRIGRLLAVAAIAAALALVFAAYLSPHLMLDMANRIWACF